MLGLNIDVWLAGKHICFSGAGAISRYLNMAVNVSKGTYTTSCNCIIFSFMKECFLLGMLSGKTAQNICGICEKTVTSVQIES